VRGSKGSKVLRTRKVKQDQWNTGDRRSMYSYFCSNGCYNDFANANIDRIVAIAPRTEPLETPINDPVKTKHETSYGHTYYNTTIKERVDNTTE
jgi:YHS domain-containing protein